MHLSIEAKSPNTVIELKPYTDYTDPSLLLARDRNLDIENVSSVVGEANVFKQDASWDKPLQKAKLCDNLIVVGPPNSGKSTFANYLVNKLSLDTVYYIEADVGQPNFGILPGVLCMGTLNTAATCNPEFTAIKTYYIDNANPGSDPELYIQSLIDLVSQVPTGAKLVVNTSGWVEGLGAYLMH